MAAAVELPPAGATSGALVGLPAPHGAGSGAAGVGPSSRIVQRPRRGPGSPGRVSHPTAARRRPEALARPVPSPSAGQRPNGGGRTGRSAGRTPSPGPSPPLAASCAPRVPRGAPRRDGSWRVRRRSGRPGSAPCPGWGAPRGRCPGVALPDLSSSPPCLVPLQPQYPPGRGPAHRGKPRSSAAPPALRRSRSVAPGLIPGRRPGAPPPARGARIGVFPVSGAGLRGHDGHQRGRRADAARASWRLARNDRGGEASDGDETDGDDRRQRGRRLASPTGQRGDRHLPHHALLADGRVGRPVGGRGPAQPLGHGARGGRDAVRGRARPAPSTGPCRPARWPRPSPRRRACC